MVSASRSAPNRLPHNFIVALFALIVVVAPLVSRASSKEDDERAKARILDRESRTYRATRHASARDPQKERRKQLERTQARLQAPILVRDHDAALKGQIDARTLPQARKTILDTHDWDADFRSAGAVVDQLKLSLASTGKPYRFGDSSVLFLGLANLGSQRRTLTAIPACGSLARTTRLVFRVTGEDGTQLVVPNVFSDNETVHPHPPLVIDSGGRLTDLADLNELVATSPGLFELVQRVHSIRISAEIPSLVLVSNPISISLQH